MALRKKVKYYDVVPETVQVPCEQFDERVRKLRKSMKRSTVEKSKVVLFYFPIVSRAGTDIEAALTDLDNFKDKYVALVVLHHTFDPESIVPDSSKAVKRDNTITVDCLFHEDKGLLQCSKNKEAITKVADWVKKLKKGKNKSKSQNKKRKEQK